MSIRRKILFYTFVIIFLIIAPIISLYSIGYRFNEKFKIWQLTGKLTINSKPNGAIVYINGKTQKNLINKFFLKKEYLTTPVKMGNLLPGKYNLELKKNGYITWQKRIKIKSGINTIIKNVQLFKNNLPLLLKNGKYSNISFLNNKKIIMFNANELNILNIENNQIKTLAKTNSIVNNSALSNAYAILSEKINDYSLSADNKYIIIFSKKNNYIIDMANFSKFKKLTAFKKRNFCWNLVKNNVFYYEKDNKIYQLTINNDNFLIKSQQIKIKNDKFQIINFLAKNNDLYLMVKEKNNLKLIQYDLSLRQIKQKKAIKLPFCNNYQSILYDKASENNLINIYDPSYQMLNLIDLYRTFSSPIKKTINNIKYFKWIDKDHLLYNNDYEIWIYDLKNNNQKLITRDSNIIEKSILYPIKNYIIYNTENSLKIIELYDKEKENINELCKFDKIYSPLLSNDGKKIYFLGLIGKKNGLYELNIK